MITESELNIAKKIVEDNDSFYDIKDELREHFEDGDQYKNILWELHKKQILNLSTEINSWYTLSGASNGYTIADCIDLFTQASKESENINSWNQYGEMTDNSVSLMKNAQGDVQPLIDALPSFLESISLSLYFEFLKNKQINVDQTPACLLTKIAEDVVDDREQSTLEEMFACWPHQDVCDAINIAATQARYIYSLDFLAFTSHSITPEQLCIIAENHRVDYDDIAPYFDQHSDAICQIALAYPVPQNYDGHSRAMALFPWLALHLKKQNQQIDDARADYLVEHLSAYDLRTNSAVLSALSDQHMEKFILKHLHKVELLNLFCNENVATRMVQRIVDWGRSELRIDKRDKKGLAVIGTRFPHVLISALQAKKIPQRLYLVDALSISTEPAAIPTLIDYLDDTIEAVRQAATKGLIKQGSAASDVLLNALSSRKKNVRFHACEALLSLASDPSLTDIIVSTTTPLFKKEKVADIKSLLATLSGQENEVSVDTNPANTVKQLLQAVSSDDHKTVKQAIKSIKANANCRDPECGCDTSENWVKNFDSYVEQIANNLLSQHGERALVVTLSAIIHHVCPHYYQLALLKKLMEHHDNNEQNALLCLTYWIQDIEADSGYTETNKHAFQFFLEYYQENAIKAAEIILSTMDSLAMDLLWSLYLPLQSANTLTVFKAFSPNASARSMALALQWSPNETYPIIIDLLAHKKLATRKHAAEALSQAPIPEALSALNKARVKEKNHALSLLMNNIAFTITLAQSDLETQLDADAPLSTDTLTQLEALLSEFAGALPKGIELENLPSLHWKTGKPLPPKVMQWVVSKLSEESAKQHSSLLVKVIAHCDNAGFKPLWDALYQQADDKSRRLGWVLFSAALLGDDILMQAYGKDLDDESRNGASASAFYKVEVLAYQSSTVALTWLDHWSRKARSQGLKERCIKALNQLAKERGISRDEISDLVSADLGFDQQGNAAFPFGDRTLTLTLSDEGSLIISLDGKVLKSAPATRKDDDADLLKVRRAELTQFRKHIKQVYRNAVERLEQAMITGRLFSPSLFNQTWGHNPLLSYIARRVVWSIQHQDKITLARLDESNQFVDIDDENITIDNESLFSVVHPLTLEEAKCIEWNNLLDDYEIVPPFAQLSRPIFTLAEGDHAYKTITRYKKEKFGTSRMRSSLEKRGWRTGEPLDGGSVQWFEKYFVQANISALIYMDEGFCMGSYDYEENQTIPHVKFFTGDYHYYSDRNNHLLELGNVSPIVYSEVINDIESIK